MNKVLTAAVALTASTLVALTAGCGGGTNAGAKVSPQPVASTSASTAAAPDIQHLADLACPTGFLASDSPTLYTAAEGTCEEPAVTISTFTSSSNQDAWLEVARSFGGVFYQGPGWVISGETQAVVDAATEHMN